MATFRFDGSYYYNKATDLREQTSKEDYEAWLHNPLTKALLLDIDGSMADSCVDWANGVYVDRDLDAQARGTVYALNLIGQLVHAHPSVQEEVA